MDGELSWKERGRLWLRLGIRLVLTLLVLWGAVRLGPPLLRLFMPFVLALILAWLLNPLIRFLHRRLGLSRRVSALALILILFAGAGALLFALVYTTVSELTQLAYNWQGIYLSAQAALDALNAELSGFVRRLPPEVTAVISQSGEGLMEWLHSTLPGLISAALSRATGLAMGVPSFAVATVVFLMGAYFISADYPRIRSLAAQRLSPGMRRFLSHARTAAAAGFGGYVRAQLLLSLGVFAILLVGFSVIGQPYGLLLAVLLAVLDFIPIVGSGTVMVPWAAVDLFLGNYRHAVELMVIWGIIALFRQVGEPKAVGHQTGLSPILSLVSIYVGMRLGGVLGMILGPVILVVLLNIGRSGVLDNVLADLSMAAADLSALLRPRDRGE